MNEQNTQTSKPIETKTLIGKGGPIAGSAISIIGNIFVLIGFVLPWASCGSMKLSGLDIVQYSLQGKLDSSIGSLLCLVPFLAIGIVGVALLTIPATLVKKLPALIKPIGTILIVLFTSLACMTSCIFFFRLQSLKNDPSNYGMGSFIQTEYGFWLSVFGLFISFLGGLIGVGSSLAEFSLSKKKPGDASPYDQINGNP